MENPKVTAKLTNLRGSSRKIKLVAEMVKGMPVEDAVETLRYTNKSAAMPIAKLILSAAANAEENMKWDRDDLYVSNILVDHAFIRRSYHIVSRGRAHPKLRRLSHVFVELQQMNPQMKAKIAKREKRSAKKVAKLADLKETKISKTETKKTKDTKKSAPKKGATKSKSKIKKTKKSK